MCRLSVCVLTPPMHSLSRVEGFLKKEISRHPGAYLPRICLANLYKDHSKDEMAMREFLEIQRLGCLSGRDSLDFAQVLYRLEDFRAVVETLEPVADRFPHERNAQWYLGASYERLGRFDKAAEYIQSAISAGLRAYEAFWHLGYCYHRLGEVESALGAYEQALVLKPSSVELRQAMVSLLMEKGLALQSADAGLAAEPFLRVLELDVTNKEAQKRLEVLGYSLPRTSNPEPPSGGADPEGNR